MMNTNLLKNPILRSKVEYELVDPSGNVLEEIKEHDIAGGINTWDLLSSTYCWISAGLGNKGKVCTATVECQNNCR